MIALRLVLERCLVRSWKLSDVDPVARHADNRNVWRNLRDRFPHPYTRANAEEWIRVAMAQLPERHFAIVVDGEAAGAIGIELRSDVYRRTAEIGYWLGEACWGRGIATEALRALSDWALAHFDLCRLYAKVFEWNPASMRVLEKAGYLCEGRLRLSVTKDGQTIDEVLYALVRPPAAPGGSA